MAKHPEFTPVRSSAIDGFHYDPATRNLHLRFTSGKVYVAREVSLERVQAFSENLSKGRYFNDQIRPFHVIDEVT